jgi:SAM-dependent methyltransferase
MQKIYRVAELPVHGRSFHLLPVRGYVDHLVDGGDSLSVGGWIALPTQPIDAADVYFNGVQTLTVPLHEWPAVASFFPWIPHAGLSAFEFKLPIGCEDRVRTGRLDLCATWKGEPVGYLSQLVRTDLDQFPTPPEDYAWRVVHTRHLHFFKVGGIKMFGDFLEAICRHLDFSSVRRVLDWGAGCGRVTAHLLAIEDGPEVLGCDIDADAIAWANANITQDAFCAISPEPPTPYPSGHFDLIVSYSVLTHLTKEIQLLWLEEMRRLLRPGGLLVVTVHGDFAAKFGFGTDNPVLPPDGIFDSILDDSLNGIAPAGYYRSTYQTREYSERVYGQLFELLEYVERGAANFQDLIVLRRR